MHEDHVRVLVLRSRTHGAIDDQRATVRCHADVDRADYIAVQGYWFDLSAHAVGDDRDERTAVAERSIPEDERRAIGSGGDLVAYAIPRLDRGAVDSAPSCSSA